MYVCVCSDMISFPRLFCANTRAGNYFEHLLSDGGLAGTVVHLRSRCMYVCQ